MEHKDYKFEIVLELIRGKNHIRALAQTIGTNHMTIHRKVHRLLEENVVDFKTEGKNKVFYLKGTVECKTVVHMAEYYNLLQLLERHGHLRKIIRHIQAHKGIGLALLFGSYAKGLETKQSDIDIYVESTDRKIKKSIAQLDARVDVKLGTYDRNHHLIKEIERDHVIIKGVERYYEQSGFFE